MQYDDECEVLEFVQYMLDNYGGGSPSRIVFVCGAPHAETLKMAARVTAQAQDFPPVALYTLPYLLPQFCRKMGVGRHGGVCISFAGQTWLVEGMAVRPCEAAGRSPCDLDEKAVARLFFAPEPAQPVQEAETPTASLPVGELARYVEGSAVQPKSAKRKGK